MSNRIVPVDSGTLSKIAKKTGKSAVTEATGTRAKVASGAAQATDERVELTGSAKIAARAEEMLAAIPDVDSARVAEVRAAIENGEYEIKADSIADALLRTALEFKR